MSVKLQLCEERSKKLHSTLIKSRYIVAVSRSRASWQNPGSKTHHQTNLLTPSYICTKIHLHQGTFDTKVHLHQITLTPNYIWHQATFTPSYICTKIDLHQDRFAPRYIWHQGTFAPNNTYTKLHLTPRFIYTSTFNFIIELSFET